MGPPLSPWGRPQRKNKKVLFLSFSLSYQHPPRLKQPESQAKKDGQLQGSRRQPTIPGCLTTSKVPFPIPLRANRCPPSQLEAVFGRNNIPYPLIRHLLQKQRVWDYRNSSHAPMIVHVWVGHVVISAYSFLGHMSYATHALHGHINCAQHDHVIYAHVWNSHVGPCVHVWGSP